MSLKKLGRYELVRVLGKGAMGIVYEGRDPNLDRRVAIKTVKVENLSEEAAAEYEARFRIEARSAARLQHPNIVSVYDSDRDGDMAFLVMEFIQGKDLKEHMDPGVRYTLADALRIMRDLLAALDYAHACGVVHRDIKPANVMHDAATGRVTVTDFGIASLDDAARTRTGLLLGTPDCMSPEQLSGAPVDGRSDLYALGVLLFRLLTGTAPHHDESMARLMHRIANEPAPDLRSLRPEVPGALADVVALALQKRPELRYSDGLEMAADLRSVAATLAPL